jgi:hypothetical protein
MRKVKSMIIALMMCLVSSMSFGQEKDTLDLSKILKDESVNLVSEVVITVDSINSNELINRFENWWGKSHLNVTETFRNYSEVRTSKTSEQITIRYVTTSFVLDMYVILIAEFKDNKIRLRFYDDGNCFKPGYYSGITYIRSIPADSYKIKSYFGDEKVIIYRPKKGPFNINEKNASGSLAYKEYMESTIDEINNFIKNTPKAEKKEW